MTIRGKAYDLAAWLQGTPFRNELAAALERQYWSPDELRRWQLAKLNALLAHAREHTSHYQNLPAAPLQDLSDFSQYPLLSKTQVRDDSASLMATSFQKSSLRKTTGGSTGAPVTVTKSKAGMATELAAVWRGLSWVGIEPGDLQARFWGVPHRLGARWKANMVDLVTSRVRCSAFAFSESDLEAFYRRIVRKKTKYFYGYPSMIKEFCRYLESKKYASPNSLRAVITTAEPLNQDDRQFISETLGVRVFNEYGCGELGTIAHECEHGSMHVNADSLIVETLSPDAEGDRSGGGGEVVVTDLENWAMPLVRYALADYATLSSAPCSCGRTLPVLSSVVGRAYDMLMDSNGRLYHGEYFLYIFEDLKKGGVDVDGFRLTQKAPDTFHLEVVARSLEAAQFVCSRFRERLQNLFSERVNVSVSLVHSIPRESSGKLRVIRRAWVGASQ